MDYEETTISLTFTENALSLGVPVNILNDTLLELDEFFTGNLRLPPGSRNIMLRPDRATATIIDNDAAIIGFVGDYRVTEGINSSVSVPIRVLDGQLGRSVMVRVFTVDGSAQGT